jgi:citronellol/citronellal dehydrogenase
LLGGEAIASQGRTPAIVADAAHAILTRPGPFTGHFTIDEDILREAGVTDFDSYAVTPGTTPLGDLFLPTNS